MKNGKNRISRTRSKYQNPCFHAKYGSLDLYDEDPKKIFIIDHEILEFNKNDGWTLIGISEKEDGTLSDHEYFCIHDNKFEIIQSTNQDINILWEFISNEPNENEYQNETTEIHDDNIQNKKRTTTKYSTNHTIQRKMQKKLSIGRKHLMTSG